MEHLKKIKKKALEELEEYGQKKELSIGDYTTIHMLTDTIKNIDKICMLEEEGGYSQAVEGDGRMASNYSRGGSYSGGSYNNGGSSQNRGGGSYNDGDGYSQARRGQHYVRGHYSYDDGKRKLVEDLENMTSRFTDKEWDMLEDFVRRIREAG